MSEQPTRSDQRGRAARPEQAAPGLRVVALGGGHGLAASLSALRRVPAVGDLTAVVTVADNGGSSGRLRHEFGCLPPGDLRQALAALCGDDDWGVTWARVLQHRFSTDGALDQHAVGNLLIVALWELLGDELVSGLDWVGGLLGAQGRVLPMAVVPIDIAAEVAGIDEDDPQALTTVRGQVEVASTAGRVLHVALDPPEPTACPEAVAAIGAADVVVLGPGSWFTSVLPHLLVPDLRQALTATSARRVVVLNLAAQTGETDGFTPAQHLSVLADHAPELRVDDVLVDGAAVGDEAHGAVPVSLRDAAAALGATLVTADVAHRDGTPRHDTDRLSSAFSRLLAGSRPESRTDSRARSRTDGRPDSRADGPADMLDRAGSGVGGHVR